MKNPEEIQEKDIQEEVQNFEKLIPKNSRISVDAPLNLKRRLNESIPPGMLSRIVRTLLEEYLDLSDEIGIGKSLKLILDKDIELTRRDE